MGHYIGNFFVFLFKATPVACGHSWARGRIGAAAGHHHSHSNAGHTCDPCHSLRQRQILHPLSQARNRTCIIMETTRGSQPAEPQQELLSNLFLIAQLKKKERDFYEFPGGLAVEDLALSLLWLWLDLWARNFHMLLPLAHPTVKKRFCTVFPTFL